MGKNIANNGFGPIYKERRQLPVKITCCLIIVFLILLNPDVDSLRFYCGLISAGIFGELVRRLCLFSEEYFHIESRYKDLSMQAFKTCIGITDFNLLSCSIFTAASTITLYDGLMSARCFIACAVFTVFVPYIFGLRMRAKLEVGHEDRARNVGVGLAWSFYIGYLKIIFEHWEKIMAKARGEGFRDKDSGKDYRQLINDKRMFIIIPKDGNCFMKLEEVDPNIEFITRMPEQKYYRAGVQRKYITSLYKIKRTEEDIFAIIEYATPVLNIFIMSQEIEEFTENDLEEQVNEFYNTLKSILRKDELCHGKYELVLMGKCADSKKTKTIGTILCEKMTV